MPSRTGVPWRFLPLLGLALNHVELDLVDLFARIMWSRPGRDFDLLQPLTDITSIAALMSSPAADRPLDFVDQIGSEFLDALDRQKSCAPDAFDDESPFSTMVAVLQMDVLALRIRYSWSPRLVIGSIEMRPCSCSRGRTGCAAICDDRSVLWLAGSNSSAHARRPP